MPGPGPGAAQNRTPLFIALGVILAGAVLIGGFALMGGGDDDDPQTGPTTSVDDTEPDLPNLPDVPDTEPTDAPSDGAVQVVDGESGFATYYDEIYEKDLFSFGFILENTSDKVARNTYITVGFLDANGTVLDSTTKSVYVLAPGQKLGIGEDALEVTGVTQLDIQIEQPTEWGDPADFGDITASGVSVVLDDNKNPTATFTATSTYTDQVDSPYAYVIFRNSAGQIVSGYYGTLSYIPAGGQAAGEVASYDSHGNITGIDLDKTEVYIDPAIY